MSQSLSVLTNSDNYTYAISLIQLFNFDDFSNAETVFNSSRTHLLFCATSSCIDTYLGQPAENVHKRFIYIVNNRPQKLFKMPFCS